MINIINSVTLLGIVFIICFIYIIIMSFKKINIEDTNKILYVDNIINNISKVKYIKEEYYNRCKHNRIFCHEIECKKKLSELNGWMHHPKCSTKWYNYRDLKTISGLPIGSCESCKDAELGGFLE